jgi:hypothetical protein
MSRDDLTSPVAAAATSQVKHCPCDEEEPHIWFRLIKAQFAAAGIKSQKLANANALASLPKQVLQDILDTIDVCNCSDERFDFLKNTLLGQFGKSKWQSYFELLRLPMEMQGLKPSVLMGKLKQNLPPGALPSNSEKTFLIIFTMLLTPGGSPPVVLFHLGLCGAVFPATSPPGPAGVWPASGARSTATHTWSPSRNGVFLIYMLIWWAHCSTVIILIIFLLSLIARPSGWKPSPFQKRPRRLSGSVTRNEPFLRKN